jgi:hypothetical protein
LVIVEAIVEVMLVGGLVEGRAVVFSIQEHQGSTSLGVVLPGGGGDGRGRGNGRIRAHGGQRLLVELPVWRHWRKGMRVLEATVRLEMG